MPRAIRMRHATPHFAHVFSGDGYSSGYYSYMWSEVMDADAFAAFEETGDAFDPATAARLEKFILSAGGSEEAEVLYTRFRGKMPGVEPLLKRRAGAAGGNVRQAAQVGRRCSIFPGVVGWAQIFGQDGGGGGTANRVPEQGAGSASIFRRIEKRPKLAHVTLKRRFGQGTSIAQLFHLGHDFGGVVAQAGVTALASDIRS